MHSEQPQSELPSANAARMHERASMSDELNRMTQQAQFLRGESNQLRAQLSVATSPSVSAQLRSRIEQTDAEVLCLEVENARQRQLIEQQNRAAESLRERQPKGSSTVTFPFGTKQPRSISPFGSVSQGTGYPPVRRASIFKPI